MASFNMSSIKISSGGAWEGDNPLQFAFPLLIIQTTIVLLLTRVLYFLLKPLRQPKVVAEMLGGILLGPSALGRNEQFMHWIFPPRSTPILESVATVGLMFFMFLIGLELDLAAIRRSGKKAIGIATASICFPFLCSAGISFFLWKSAVEKVNYGQFLIFMGVSLSITAFPVLARILAELRMLTTEVGQTAMAAAAFNDVAAWILLALAVALAGGRSVHKKTPLVSIWVLLSAVAFVAFMLILVRRIMKWWIKHTNSSLDEGNICLILASVMVSGFITDLIGIHAIFGAFVFGLTIPKDGEFAANLMKRTEDFVSGLLLPLYFASSGLKTDVSAIYGLQAWGLLALVISTACAGKILGTFFAAMIFMIPVRESLTLGILMNTKGLVELIVLNIGKEKGVLNDEMFAIFVLMAIFTTFMTTPIAMALYRPDRKFSSQPKTLELEESNYTAPESTAELRILACIRGPEDSSPIVNLIEVCRSTQLSQIKFYAMQLLQLTERSSSILMVQRVRKNGVSCVGRSSGADPADLIAASFKAYSQGCRVRVRPTTSISGLSTMHEDICYVADKKRAAMIILPFHKAWRRDGDEEREIDFGNGWREVNQRVIQNAPCPVAVMVDRGFGVAFQHNSGDVNAATKRVCIIFLGGPDCLKALQLGCRMAEHPAVKVSVLRFQLLKHSEDDTMAEVVIEDSAILAELRRKWNGKVDYIEKETDNLVEEMVAIGERGEFELVVVGRGKQLSPQVTAHLAENKAEFNELGYVGDLLTSSPGGGIKCSVLVIQNNDSKEECGIPNSEMGNCNTA